MALIIPVGYAQVTISYTGSMFDSGGAATTFGVGTGILTNEALENVAERVEEAFDDNLRPQLDSDVTVTNIRAVTSLYGVDRPVNLVGGASGLAPSPNVALLVRKNVSERGPRAKGRLFAPAMLRQGDVNEDGTLTTPAFNTQVAAFNGFYSQLQENEGWNMYILQNSEGQTPFLQPPPIVTSLAAQPKVATQRRRLRR